MNFIDWWPVVTKSQLGHNALTIHVLFSCPSCLTHMNFQTDGHVITPIDRGLLLEFKFDEIRKAKACPVCGIVSVVPTKDKNKLFNDIRTIITDQWLHSRAAEENPVEIRQSTLIFTCLSI